MAGENSLKQVIQGLMTVDTQILQGRVQSVAPLKIQMLHDEKLVISSQNTYVPRHLTDCTAEIDIAQRGGEIDSQTYLDGSHSHAYSGTTGSGGSSAHTHPYQGETEPTNHRHALATFNIQGFQITTHNALKVGEHVYVLSLNHGKQYYVLDRVSWFAGKGDD